MQKKSYQTVNFSRMFVTFATKQIDMEKQMFDEFPGWENAPESAIGWAVDADGSGYWFLVSRDNDYGWYSDSQKCPGNFDSSNWKNSLILRQPTKQEKPHPLFPGWDVAPDWAMQFAIDESGKSFWYDDSEISALDKIWGEALFNGIPTYKCEFYKDFGPYPEWRNSLVKRPTKDK